MCVSGEVASTVPDDLGVALLCLAPCHVWTINVCRLALARFIVIFMIIVTLKSIFSVPDDWALCLASPCIATALDGKSGMIFIT